MRAAVLIVTFGMLATVGAALVEKGGTAAEQDAANKTATREPAAESKPVDITDEVRKYNSDKYASPPTEFRQGHVTPRQLPASALKRNKTGYVVQLPSGAPVLTPAVYNGKVYASGGFHSKEFYCFDAQTGEVVWALDLDDDGPSSAVCSDGVTVFNTESCTLFAVDSETGKQLWSWWLGDPLTSTPAIANGRVFTSYPASGRGGGPFQEVQQAAPPDPPGQEALGPPPPPPGPAPQQQIQSQAKPKQPSRKAAIRQDEGQPRPPYSHVLACFDLKSGKVLWQRWIDSDVMSAPVAVGDELFATSFAGTLYRVDQKTGKILSAVRSRATSAPVVVDGEVFITQRHDSGSGPAREAITRKGADKLADFGQYSSVSKAAAYLDRAVQQQSKQAEQAAKLDAANGFGAGAPAAANPQSALANIGQANVSTMQAFQGSRFTRYGERNFNCMGDEILATDPKTGKQLWSVKLEGDLAREGGFLAAPPAAAGGQLVVATLRGEILQLDPKSGKVKARHKVGSPIRSQPAVAHGRIYIGTDDGKLVCIDTGDRKLTGWPMWGGNAAHTGVAQAQTPKIE
jgi:outer membrane protein assembly factor BamB